MSSNLKSLFAVVSTKLMMSRSVLISVLMLVDIGLSTAAVLGVIATLQA